MKHKINMNLPGIPLLFMALSGCGHLEAGMGLQQDVELRERQVLNKNLAQKKPKQKRSWAYAQGRNRDNNLANIVAVLVQVETLRQTHALSSGA